MNRQTFFTFGGALLASTALTSGAMAGSVGQIGAGGTAYSTTSIKVANTLFSTTATTADAITLGGAQNFALSFCSSCNIPSNTSFGVNLTFTGASPSNVTTGSVSLLLRSTGNLTTFAGTVGANTSLICTSAAAIGQAVLIAGCTVTTGSTGVLVGGILFSGLQFTTANALAAIGGTVTVSGNVSTSGSTIDTLTGTVLTGATPAVVTVTTPASATISAQSTPNAFTYLQDTQAGTFGNNSIYTVTLAAITLSSVAGVKDTTLTTDVTLPAVVSSVNITVTSAALNAAASYAMPFTDGTQGTAITTAAFSTSNTVTFTINTSAANHQFLVKVVYDGTTQIPAAATAGSVTAKLATGSAAVQALSSGAGSTASVSRGGFNGELNGLYSSAISKLTTPAYNSYIRIHNQGAVAGAATITVVHDATGVKIGSFTTSSIAAGATLQLSAAALETGAGVTTSAIELYTVQVTGPFVGYTQHVVYNPTTGAINDLSSFRNSGATVGSP